MYCINTIGSDCLLQLYVAMDTAICKPIIYNYDDYRLFLSDWIGFMQATSGSNATFKAISTRAGFKSPNYVQMLIQGKRNLTQLSSHKIASAIGLSEKESEFFQSLVAFNQSKTNEEISSSRQQLMKSSKYRKLHPVRSAKIHYYTKWYYIPIREMVVLADFKEDPEWIAKRLYGQVTTNEATEAFRDLIELGLLKRDETNKLQQVDRTVRPDDKISSSAIVEFHESMIKKSSAALVNLSDLERDISCLTIPATEDAVTRMKMIINETKRQLLLISEDCDKSEDIFQVNFQFFPLTKKIDDEGGKE